MQSKLLLYCSPVAHKSRPHISHDHIGGVTMSRDVSAVAAMMCAEMFLATCNATVKWAGSWPATRIMLVRFPITPSP